MSFSQLLAGYAPDRDTVLTVGVFDGVHLGHRHLLDHLIDWASPGCLPGVITFSNRPVTVFRPGTFPSYLTTPEHKIDLLRRAGIELIVPLEFTEKLSQVTARQFAELLSGTLRMKGLVLGPDSALGKGREGDLAYMQAEGERLGFWVRSVEPLEMNDRPVKSRVVREALVAGDVSDGSRLLGRNHTLGGKVVVGDQRGRTLGFPTANIEVYPGLLWPGDGIYATWAYFGGRAPPVGHLHRRAPHLRPYATAGGSLRHGLLRRPLRPADDRRVRREGAEPGNLRRHRRPDSPHRAGRGRLPRRPGQRRIPSPSGGGLGWG